VFMVRDGAVSSNGDLLGFSVDQQAVALDALIRRIRELRHAAEGLR